MAEKLRTLADVSVEEDRERLSELLNRRFEIQREVKALEEEQKTLNGEISMLMGVYEIGRIDMGVFVGSIQNGCSSTINRERLLNQGVDPDVIEAATVRREYTTVMVKAKKEKGDGGDEG